jgi:DNA-binding MarR family transcriptional regulator
MAMVEATATPCTSAGLLLAKIGRAAAREFRDVLRPAGLKPSHMAALSALRNGPMTQQALGDAVGTDPTKMVGFLNDLEAAALVVRRRDEADRRRHIVELSPDGACRLSAADRAVAEAEERLLGSLTHEERAHLRALLARVDEHVPAGEACPDADD